MYRQKQRVAGDRNAQWHAEALTVNCKLRVRVTRRHLVGGGQINAVCALGATANCQRRLGPPTIAQRIPARLRDPLSFPPCGTDGPHHRAAALGRPRILELKIRQAGLGRAGKFPCRAGYGGGGGWYTAGASHPRCPTPPTGPALPLPRHGAGANPQRRASFRKRV